MAQSCLTLRNPKDCSTPGFPILHYLLEFAQTHIHWISDAIQPSHPLSSSSPLDFSSQHQDLFQWINSLQPYGLRHTRLSCPSTSPGTCSNSCPLNQWCHPTISSSVAPFFSCLQSFPASGSFLRSQLFTSRGQSIRASALTSVLPLNFQGWFSIGLTGLISLLSKGLSRNASFN